MALPKSPNTVLDGLQTILIALSREPEPVGGNTCKLDQEVEAINAQIAVNTVKSALDLCRQPLTKRRLACGSDVVALALFARGDQGLRGLFEQVIDVRALKQLAPDIAAALARYLGGPDRVEVAQIGGTLELSQDAVAAVVQARRPVISQNCLDRLLAEA